MVSLIEIERQLKKLGITFYLWGRAELRELPKILLPNEEIKACMNGRYEGGFAMLCATDQRLLLIDKKPMFLNLLDLRYDMISEVDYGYRLLNASMKVCTPNKNFSFTAWKQSELRDLAVYIQQRVIDLRTAQNNQETVTQERVLNTVQDGSREFVPGFIPLQAVANAQAQGQTLQSLYPTTTALPQKRYSKNPYTQSPVMMRQRVSRFGQFLMK